MVGPGTTSQRHDPDLNAVEETRFIRRVSLDEPLDVRLDGRTRLGAIFKPER